MISVIILAFIVSTIFIIFIIKKKYYEYIKKEEEKERISDLEYKFQFYSDNIFYMTVIKILIKIGFLKNFVNIDKMMEDAFELYYAEDSVFRDECYKNGIRRRFIDYMEENKKKI
uniref:Uncharacterized protein n=1 Tax=viral metagenome TaxID=1070528 RepID=A0A6C0IHE5_9ZZZZ